jgi:hypothetical protein
MPPPHGHCEVIMERKPFDCPATGGLCADGRCARGRCFQQQVESAERRRQEVASAEAEENEIRKEAEEIARMAFKLKHIRRPTEDQVRKLARRPDVMIAAKRLFTERKAQLKLHPLKL